MNKNKDKQQTDDGVVVDSTHLLSFEVGSHLNINDEFVATIEEVQGEMIRLSSIQFNGWANKNELQAIPT